MRFNAQTIIHGREREREKRRSCCNINWLHCGSVVRVLLSAFSWNAVLSVHPCDRDLFILFSSHPFLFIILASCAECALLLLLSHFNPLIEGVSHLPRTHTLAPVAVARFSYFTQNLIRAPQWCLVFGVLNPPENKAQNALFDQGNKTHDALEQLLCRRAVGSCRSA